MTSPERVKADKVFRVHKFSEDRVFKSDEANFHVLSLTRKFRDQLGKTDAFKKALAQSFLLGGANQLKVAGFQSGSNIVTVTIDGSRLEINIIKSTVNRSKTAGKIKEPVAEYLVMSPVTSQTLPFVEYTKLFNDGTSNRIDNNIEAIGGAEGMLRTLKKGASKIPLFRR